MFRDSPTYGHCYPNSDDIAPYGLTSWEQRFELDGGYGPDWAKKQESCLARAQARFSLQPKDGAKTSQMQTDIPAIVEDSLRDPSEDSAGKDTASQNTQPLLQPNIRKPFKFGYGLAVVQGKVPAPKPFQMAPVGSSDVKSTSSCFPDASTPRSVTEKAPSCDTVKDNVKAAVSIVQPALKVPQQPCQANTNGVIQNLTAIITEPVQNVSVGQEQVAYEKATLKAQDDDIASKPSSAAMSRAEYMALKPSQELTIRGSSHAANAKLASGSRSTTDPYKNRASCRWSSADSVQQSHYHGPGRITVGKGTPTQAQHARDAQRQHDARADAWRQRRARQLFEQRQQQERQEQEKLKREEEVSRAKAARQAEAKRATEKRLAALNALPKAERDRRNAQLKASRDFSDGPDFKRAPPPSGRSLQRATAVQAKPAFKPSASYSSLAKAAKTTQASQAGSLAAKVPTKATDVSGRPSSKAKPAGKSIPHVNAAGVAHQAQKPKPATQVRNGKAKAAATKEKRAEADRQAALKEAEAQAQAAARAADEEYAIWEKEEMATRRRNEEAATAARLRRELERQEAQKRREQEEAAAAALACARAAAVEEERAAEAAAHAQAQAVQQQHAEEACAQAVAQAQEERKLQQAPDDLMTDVDEMFAEYTSKQGHQQKAYQPAGPGAAQELHQLYAYWQSDLGMAANSSQDNLAGAVCWLADGSHSKATASGLLGSHTLPSDMTAQATHNGVSSKFGSHISATAGRQVTSNTTASDKTAVKASNSSRRASSSSAAAGGLFKAQALPPISTAAATSNGGVRKKLAHDSNLSTAGNGVSTSHGVPSISVAAKATEKLVRSRLANDNNFDAAAGGLPIAHTSSQNSMAANVTNGNAMSQSGAKSTQTGSPIRSKLGRKRKLKHDNIVTDTKSRDEDMLAQAPAAKRIKAIIFKDAHGVAHRLETGASTGSLHTKPILNRLPPLAPRPAIWK